MWRFALALAAAAIAAALAVEGLALAGPEARQAHLAGPACARGSA